MSDRPGGKRPARPNPQARHADTRQAGRHKSVTSAANPLVKDIRALGQKKHRDSSGLFAAEGLQLVRYALDADWPVETFIYASDAMADTSVQEAAARCKTGGALLLEVSRAVLSRLSRRDNPQSVIGVFGQRHAELSGVGHHGLWIVLEEIRDPGNLGTIIRTIDAAGGSGVVLAGQCCDPFSPEAVRATMGSIFHVPVATATTETLVAQAKKTEAPLIGTHLSGEADFRHVVYPHPAMIVMGNEQKGLSPQLTRACDQLVRIPMAGRAESLNLAVATGLMIYEAVRERL